MWPTILLYIYRIQSCSLCYVFYIYFIILPFRIVNVLAQMVSPGRSIYSIGLMLPGKFNFLTSLLTFPYLTRASAVLGRTHCVPDELWRCNNDITNQQNPLHWWGRTLTEDWKGYCFFYKGKQENACRIHSTGLVIKVFLQCHVSDDEYLIQ